MCIQSSCTIVYNLALDRGRRSLQGEWEHHYDNQPFVTGFFYVSDDLTFREIHFNMFDNGYDLQYKDRKIVRIPDVNAYAGTAANKDRHWYGADKHCR